MTDPFLNEGKIKLEEGLTFSFRVLSIVKLQDERDYYILEDPNGMKHFIDAEAYAYYGFKSGSRIKCLVAKINCTGRILLEPIHPIYVCGLSYFFNLSSVEQNGSNINMILEDIFRNKIEIVLPKSFFPSIEEVKSIKCKVINVKKGVPKIEFIP
jgi:hypothetical protein